MEVQTLVQSFEFMLNKLEDEKKVLQSLVSFQSIPPQQCPPEILDKLIQMDQSVSLLEEQLDSLDTFIDSELAVVTKLQTLAINSKLVQETIENLSQQLNGESSSNIENQNNQANSNKGDVAKPSTTTGLITLVTPEELDNASKATKGRLTLAQINQFLLIIGQLIEKKRKTLVQLKKIKFQDQTPLTEYENKRIAEHGNSTYLTESELRSSPIFESGDATGKAVLHTLRVLHRLRLVRSGQESTYILANKQA